MKQITGHTGLTGLFGSPVAHSISPMMHNASFEHLGLDYVYLAFDVGTDKLAAAVDGLRAMNVRGFNLTMPDKNKMCELCDRLSPAAEISQAVNTVVNDNGILTGHTTDGTGYLLAAKDAGYDLIGKKMTLLGAGGAATSILVQAALDGLSEISVFSIHDQFYVRAEQIVQTLNERTNCKVQLFDFEDDSILRREIADSYILTNGTSVGMLRIQTLPSSTIRPFSIKTDRFRCDLQSERDKTAAPCQRSRMSDFQRTLYAAVPGGGGIQAVDRAGDACGED